MIVELATPAIDRIDRIALAHPARVAAYATMACGGRSADYPAAFKHSIFDEGLRMPARYAYGNRADHQI
jgi:hypothetical protein